MAYELQLVDARNDFGIRNISGVCSGGEQLADYVDRAERQLMKRGAWFGSEVMMRLCASGCDVVFPRHVGTVLGVKLCGQDYMPLRNRWWSILNPGNLGGWNTTFNSGISAGYGEAYPGYMQPGVDANTVPTFNQISGNTGKLIRYHVVKSQDYGKTITLFGTKYGGQPLQTEVAGTWQDGISITAANPVAQTTDLVTKITSVVREPTQGMAYLYEYDTTTMKLRMLAVYEPNETNPSYRHMAMPAMSCAPHSTDANGVNTWQFEAIVLLQHIKLQNDNDFLIIDDLDALKYAIQAIKAEEAGDDASAEVKWTKAIRELNYRDRQKNPSDQLTVRVRTMGSNRILTSPL